MVYNLRRRATNDDLRPLEQYPVVATRSGRTSVVESGTGVRGTRTAGVIPSRRRPALSRRRGVVVETTTTTGRAPTLTTTLAIAALSATMAASATLFGAVAAAETAASRSRFAFRRTTTTFANAPLPSLPSSASIVSNRYAPTPPWPRDTVPFAIPFLRWSSGGSSSSTSRCSNGASPVHSRSPTQISSSSDSELVGVADDIDSYENADYGDSDDNGHSFGFDEEEEEERVRCLAELFRLYEKAKFGDDDGYTDSADLDARCEDMARSSHRSLLRLSSLVYLWNSRLNLVSRKECTSPKYVYDRHVLPSVALLPLIPADARVADVGTGGGFPGLPLAILLPNVEFTLVDSVKKKLVAVTEMASELDLENVQVHWGRAEEMAGDEEGQHANKYDVVLGRSVTSLPRFCFWVTDLLRKRGQIDEIGGDDEGENGGGGGREGRVVYIIGGEIEPSVQSRVAYETSIDALLGHTGGSVSDKRALVLNSSDVRIIAKDSGEVKRKMPSGKGKGRRKGDNKGGGDSGGAGKNLARGEWSKKRNDVKKNRGYDDFKRYEF